MLKTVRCTPQKRGAQNPLRDKSSGAGHSEDSTRSSKRDGLLHPLRSRVWFRRRPPATAHVVLLILVAQLGAAREPLDSLAGYHHSWPGGEVSRSSQGALWRMIGRAPALPMLRGGATMELPLPVGWEEFVDDEYQISYFYHAATGDTVWERPEATTFGSPLLEPQPPIAMPPTQPPLPPPMPPTQPLLTPPMPSAQPPLPPSMPPTQPPPAGKEWQHFVSEPGSAATEPTGRCVSEPAAASPSPPIDYRTDPAVVDCRIARIDTSQGTISNSQPGGTGAVATATPPMPLPSVVEEKGKGWWSSTTSVMRSSSMPLDVAAAAAGTRALICAITCTYISVCVYIYMYKYVYIHICEYIHIQYIHVYVHINIYVYAYIDIYIQIYIYAYVYLYIYIYIHIFICTYI